MWFSIWFFWYRTQPLLPKLYVICVTIAYIYADTYLSNFVQVLQNNLLFSSFAASATINLNDVVNGIFSIIGAILCDELLTHHGIIFLSSAIYFIGLTIIAAENQRSGYVLTFYGSSYLETRSLNYNAFDVQNWTSIILVGLFLTGIGKLSIMNSSTELSEENGGTDQRYSNSFTKFIEFVFGDDTAILRYVQSHGYIIVLVFTKYATKTVFIVVSSLIGSTYSPSITSEAYHNIVGPWLPAIGLGLVSFISLVYVKSFIKPVAKRQQTPLRHVLCVFIAVIRKRHILCPPDPPIEFLYERNSEYQLKHTVGFSFLDKAAIVQSAEPREERKQWSLCTVTEVEETKLLLRMLPMCITFFGYGIVKSMGNTVFLLQGSTMRNKFGKTEVPIQALIVLGEISGSITRGLYRLLLSKRLGSMYGAPIKYAIGIVLATFCCTVASWIAADKVDFIWLWRAKEVAASYEDSNMGSILWLIPQFLLFGAMSEVTRDGIKGFFPDQLPPSLMRYDTAFTDATTGAGTIFSILIAYALGFHATFHQSYPLSWFRLGNVYSNKELEKYYRVLTVFSFIFLSVYAFIASRYKYKHSNGNLSS